MRVALPQPTAMVNKAASRGRTALRAVGRVVAAVRVCATEWSGGFFLEEGV